MIWPNVQTLVGGINIIGIFVANAQFELARNAGAHQQCIKSLYTFVLPDKAQKTNLLTVDLKTKRFVCKLHSGPETAPTGSVVESGPGLADLRLSRCRYGLDLHVPVAELSSLRSTLDAAGMLCAFCGSSTNSFCSSFFSCSSFRKPHFSFPHYKVEQHIAKLDDLPCLLNGSLVREDDERKAPPNAELIVLQPGLGQLSTASNTAHLTGSLESRTYYSPKRDSYADVRRAVLRDLRNSLQFRLDHLLIKGLDTGDAKLPPSFQLALPSRQFFQDSAGWLHSSNLPPELDLATAQRKLSKLLRREVESAGGEHIPSIAPLQLQRQRDVPTKKAQPAATTKTNNNTTTQSLPTKPNTSPPTQTSSWIPPPSILGALLLLLVAFLMSKMITALGVPPKPGAKS